MALARLYHISSEAQTVFAPCLFCCAVFNLTARFHRCVGPQAQVRNKRSQFRMVPDQRAQSVFCLLLILVGVAWKLSDSSGGQLEAKPIEERPETASGLSGDAADRSLVQAEPRYQNNHADEEEILSEASIRRAEKHMDRTAKPIECFITILYGLWQKWPEERWPLHCCPYDLFHVLKFCYETQTATTTTTTQKPDGSTSAQPLITSSTRPPPT